MNRGNEYEKTLVVLTLILVILSTMTYADSDKRVIIRTLADGNQYLVFNVKATSVDATYRYRTKGWHIDATFGDRSFSGFYRDSQLEESSSDTTVMLPLKDILEEIGVTDEYLRQGGTLELDAGQIILVDGKETSPMYDSYSGIVNGIVDRYGVEWSSQTKEDLQSYYGLSLSFDPVIEPTELEINYYDVDTGDKLKSTETVILEDGYNTVNIPNMAGYEFQYWIYDNGSQKIFDTADIYSNGDGEIHTLDIYYAEVEEYIYLEIKDVSPLTIGPIDVGKGK